MRVRFAGDRRGDRCVAEVDLRRLHRGPGRGHISLGGFLRGHRVDVVLLADGVGLQQRLVAFGLRAGLRQVGFGLGQTGLGAGNGGLIGAGIHLEQGLAGFDVAAFAKQALLQDAGGARAHLRHARRFESARQLGDQAHVARGHGDHADLGRWHAARRAGGHRVARSAACQQGRQPDGTPAVARAPGQGGAVGNSGRWNRHGVFPDDVQGQWRSLRGRQSQTM